MNKYRRDELTKIIDQLDAIRGMLDELYEQEQDARDNLPENLEGSERYERMDAAAGALEEAIFNLDSTVEEIQNAIEA